MSAASRGEREPVVSALSVVSEKRHMSTKTKSQSRHAKVYVDITKRFVSAIESGVSPFKIPWSTEFGVPRNYADRPYRGINFFLALLSCQELGWDIPVFMTYKQAKEAGYQVRKGEKSMKVTFASMTVPAEYKCDPESCPPEERYFYRKLYSVFNVAQIEDIDFSEFKSEAASFEPHKKAQEIVDGYKGAPPILHGGVRAFYHPKKDEVTLPTADRFHSTGGYFEVLYHELGHSTAHPGRLGRPIENKRSSKEYAFEELIAELTSSFLCAEAGLLDTTFENSASYLNEWLEAFKSDPRYLIKAASKAQKAADHILGRTFTKESEA